MLLVRNEKIVIDEDSYYIIGSSSNKLYEANSYCMRDLELLTWELNKNSVDISKLEKYVDNKNLKFVLGDDSISFFKKCKRIKEEVKKQQIIVAKLSIIDALVASHYALKYRKTLVIESASDAYAAFRYHGGSIKYRLAARPLDMLAKHYHKKANYIIYVSQHFLQEKYHSKAVSIGCPDVILDKTPESVLEKRINRINSKREFVVGLVGATQAEYRGHDTLIKAVGLLNKQGINDIKIKFLGGGTANEKRIKCAKENEIEDRVEFCGRVSRDNVLTWLDDVDVLAMPTMVESLGRAALEAMSRGCAVIGSIETALREIIPGDCLVKARDYVSLANIIKKIYLDKNYFEICARSNYYSAQRYSKEIIMKTRKEFYDMIVEESQK